MSKHYQAPKHVTGIMCPSGNEYRANDNGNIEVPDDAPEGDHSAVMAAGFVAGDGKAPAAPVEQPAVVPAPAELSAEVPADEAAKANAKKA